jgi:DnaJ homolog subfamily C member 19
MTRKEAAQIVGVKYLLERVWLIASDRHMTRAKLAERYKSVMLANHPDRGGSPYMALKINEARRVLAPFARWRDL